MKTIKFRIQRDVPVSLRRDHDHLYFTLGKETYEHYACDVAAISTRNLFTLVWLLTRACVTVEVNELRLGHFSISLDAWTIWLPLQRPVGVFKSLELELAGDFDGLCWLFRQPGFNDL